MKRTQLWAWLKAHIVWLSLEKDPRTDSKGGAWGFRWRW